MNTLNLKQMYAVELQHRDGDWWRYADGMATEDIAATTGAALVPTYGTAFRVVPMSVATRREAETRIAELRQQLSDVQTASHTGVNGKPLAWYWSKGGIAISDRIRRELRVGRNPEPIGSPDYLLDVAADLASSLG